jgi:hypothetical protein
MPPRIRRPRPKDNAAASNTVPSSKDDDPALETAVPPQARWSWARDESKYDRLPSNMRSLSQRRRPQPRDGNPAPSMTPSPQRQRSRARDNSAASGTASHSRAPRPHLRDDSPKLEMAPPPRTRRPRPKDDSLTLHSWHKPEWCGNKSSEFL